MKLNVIFESEFDGFELNNLNSLLQNFWDLLKQEFDSEVSILFCSNQTIQHLNLEFRGKDTPTDVLSFPSETDSFLGDIAISIDKAKEQTETTVEKELEKLLCHGLLHLLGYEDEAEETKVQEMMTIEAFLLKNKTVDLIWS